MKIRAGDTVRYQGTLWCVTGINRRNCTLHDLKPYLRYEYDEGVRINPDYSKLFDVPVRDVERLMIYMRSTLTLRQVTRTPDGKRIINKRTLRIGDEYPVRKLAFGHSSQTNSFETGAWICAGDMNFYLHINEYRHLESEEKAA